MPFWVAMAFAHLGVDHFCRFSGSSGQGCRCQQADRHKQLSHDFLSYCRGCRRDAGRADSSYENASADKRFHRSRTIEQGRSDAVTTWRVSHLSMPAVRPGTYQEVFPATINRTGGIETR